MQVGYSTESMTTLAFLLRSAAEDKSNPNPVALNLKTALYCFKFGGK